MGDPYISVVVAARNDDHGDNMLRRMQAFLDSWIVQAERLGLESEILVVEWNPPANRPRLLEELNLAGGGTVCRVRSVEVPASVHAAVPNAEAIPLHQMIAKNSGIRRARGEFVLATNLDIVFSREMMQFLAERRLEHGAIYRVDRYDVDCDIPPAAAGVDALLEHCRSRVVRLFTAENYLRCERGELISTEPDDIAAPGIDFGQGWMPVERHEDFRYRWASSPGRLVFHRPPGACLRIDAEVGPSQGGLPLCIEVAEDLGTVVARSELSGRCQLRLFIPDPIERGAFSINFQGQNMPLCPDLRMLHFRARGLWWEKDAGESDCWRLEVIETAPERNWSSTPSARARNVHNAAWLHANASGDFTLLSREDWFHLRGYPEFPIWPLHIDALFCYAAHHAGIRERVLREPAQIFHIEHRSGAGWSPEGEETISRRVSAKQVPVLDFDADLGRWVQQMRRWDAPVIFNLENWGLAGQELQELSLSGPA